MNKQMFRLNSLEFVYARLSISTFIMYKATATFLFQNLIYTDIYISLNAVHFLCLENEFLFELNLSLFLQ